MLRILQWAYYKTIKYGADHAVEKYLQKNNKFDAYINSLIL
jgi:hypothetical protein